MKPATSIAFGIVALGASLAIIFAFVSDDHPAKHINSRRIAGATYASDTPAGEKELVLFEAVQSGDLEQLRYAMGKQPNVNAGNKSGESALHLIARQGMTTDHASDRSIDKDAEMTDEAIQMLLSRGAVVDIRDDGGSTPLMTCGLFGKAWIPLLKAGANPNASNHGGVTPLFYCNAEAASAEIDAGANVNAVDIAGNTPLHETASMGEYDKAKLLIDHGAIINAKNSKGETPLRLAKLSFRTQIIQYLQDHGATE